MSNIVKHNPRRVLRHRTLNVNRTISVLFGGWDRTVSFSDIRKYFECPGAYLMGVEGDAKYRRGLSEEIGDLLHEQTAKPVEERLQDTREIARRLKNVREEDRENVAIAVREMIAKAVQVNDIESIDAEVTEHEILMVWHDKYTDTTWYAKPDKMDLISEADGRKHLSVVDQKTGKYRKRFDKTGAFFFGYVAKMTSAFDFKGPVKTIVRYLRNRDGQLLDTPEERIDWIGRRLNPAQEDVLQGIQETIRKMDMDWKRGEFELQPGNHCRGCQFRHTCPVNAERWAAQLEWEAQKILENRAPAPAIVVTETAATPLSVPVELVAMQAQVSNSALLSA